MIRRHPLLSALLVLLLLLAGLAWQNRTDLFAFPGIIGAYSAKEYCSCRFVANNPAEYCASYVALYLPLSALHEDAPLKQVTARGLGVTQSAQWLGPRQGCQLLPQALPLP